MYDELVKTMRHCVATMDCLTCPVESIDKSAKAQKRCLTLVLAQAADAIEELMRFAYFVAREVVVTDEEWELNNMAFPEIICRKLNNLGVVSKAGEMWHYEPPEEV